MANTASAKKRIRQNEKRRTRNKTVRSRARNRVRDARAAIAAGDLEQAQEAVRKATSDLDRAASKGTLHQKNASRRISRLMKRLAAIQES